MTRFPPDRRWAKFLTDWGIVSGGFRKPALKKIPETDAIFENVHASRIRAAGREDILRISLDTKAKVKVSEFSRGGSSRGSKAVKALDHDMSPNASLVPFGILELSQGEKLIHQPWLLFGHSRETADFLVDGFEQWWEERKVNYPGVKRLQLELDNGPELNSSRTQFMKRLVEFVDQSEIEIELVYFPPYHSKYNPIERVWGVLENHWNGTLLNTIWLVLEWALSMRWRNTAPIVRENKQTYKRGVRLNKKEFHQYEQRLTRSETLPKWSLSILRL